MGLSSMLATPKIVPLECGLEAAVFPMGIRQMRDFSRASGAAMALIGDLDLGPLIRGLRGGQQSPEGNSQATTADQEIPSALPAVRGFLTAIPELLCECSDLIDAVTVIRQPGQSLEEAVQSADRARVTDLPHWELPGVVLAFIEASFGAEGNRFAPWGRLLGEIVTGLVKTRTGKSKTSETPSTT